MTPVAGTIPLWSEQHVCSAQETHPAEVGFMVLQTCWDQFLNMLAEKLLKNGQQEDFMPTFQKHHKTKHQVNHI